jgi:hypothetical protein
LASPSRSPSKAARRAAMAKRAWSSASEKRHLYRLIVVVVLALMDDGDHQIVGVKLELIERIERGRDMRLAHAVNETLQQTERRVRPLPRK